MASYKIGRCEGGKGSWPIQSRYNSRRWKEKCTQTLHLRGLPGGRLEVNIQIAILFSFTSIEELEWAPRGKDRRRLSARGWLSIWLSF